MFNLSYHPTRLSKKMYQVPYIDELSAVPADWNQLVHGAISYWKHHSVEAIVALEGRGMIIGSLMAYLMGVPLIPLRKAGKLPAKTKKFTTDRGVLEIHHDALVKEQKVLVVDGLWNEEMDGSGALQLLEEGLEANIVGIQCFSIPDASRSTLQPYTTLELLKHKEMKSEKIKELSIQTISSLDDLKKHIRTIPDFPIPGILFRDISSLLQQPTLFQHCIEYFVNRYQKTFSASERPTKIVGLESRGFLFGAPLAYRLGIPFIPVSKKGKIPVQKVSVSYQIEYGFDEVELSQQALSAQDRVLVVDDLIATGGTAAAACELVKQLSASIVEVACVIELPELKGKEKLGHPLFTLIKFEGH
jgi:adenine phosphoribosyltransferase